MDFIGHIYGHKFIFELGYKKKMFGGKKRSFKSQNEAYALGKKHI